MIRHRLGRLAGRIDRALLTYLLRRGSPFAAGYLETMR